MEVNFRFPSFSAFPFIFKPVVDNATSDAFFPKDPYDLMRVGEFNKESDSTI
jgi:hypothetical protein